MWIRHRVDSISIALNDNSSPLKGLGHLDKTVLKVLTLRRICQRTEQILGCLPLNRDPRDLSDRVIPNRERCTTRAHRDRAMIILIIAKDASEVVRTLFP